MSGTAFTATSMSTQSWKDAASTTPEPKRSHAHLTAADAGLPSSSAETAASSPRSTSTRGRVIADSSMLILSPPRGARREPSGEGRACFLPSCRALTLADFGDVGTGLSVVDEEVGTLVGSGVVVELGNRLADALGATGAA